MESRYKSTMHVPDPVRRILFFVLLVASPGPALGSIIYPMSIEEICQDADVWVVGKLTVETETYAGFVRNFGFTYQIIGSIAVERATDESLPAVVRFADTCPLPEGRGPKLIAALMSNGDGTYRVAGGRYSWGGISDPEEFPMLFDLGVSTTELWRFVEDLMRVRHADTQELAEPVRRRRNDLGSNRYQDRYLAYRFFGMFDEFPIPAEEIRDAIQKDLTRFEDVNRLQQSWFESQWIDLENYPSAEHETRKLIVAVRQVRPNIHSEIVELDPLVAAENPRALYDLAQVYDSLQQDRTAYELYARAADRGHAPSMYAVSRILRYSDFGSKQEAREWLVQAANRGSVQAQNDLGRMFSHQYEHFYNPAQSVYWYIKAAEQGNTFAMHELGEAYLQGNGVESDPVKALEWFERAGDAWSTFEIGKMYRDGIGVPKDAEKAFKLFEYAATDITGYEAWFALAECYAYGVGTEVDLTEAYAHAEFGAVGNGFNDYEFAGLRSILDDLIADGERQVAIERARKRLRMTLENQRLGINVRELHAR